MKITGLGYKNQIKQNYKNEQQKSPAFKGELYIIGNPNKVPSLSEIVIGVVQEIEKRTLQGISEITKRIKNKNSIAIIPIPSNFDTFGAQLAASLEEESFSKAIPIKYIFKVSPKLN